MGTKAAINGYGHIGRQIARAIFDYKLQDQLDIVTINANGSIETNARLTKSDTVHGRLDADVSHDEKHPTINGKKILYSSTRNPAELPWGELGIDLVMECTGAFISKEKTKTCLENNAKKALIPVPGGDDVDATIVYGINDGVITGDMTVISNTSRTTNYLAPVAKVLNGNTSIINGMVTTTHALTNDRTVTDVRYRDLRRMYSGVEDTIPTKTSAAKTVGLVLSAPRGKLDGLATHVPAINVSLVDLSFQASRKTSVEGINALMKAAPGESRLKGVLGYNVPPLAFTDFSYTTQASAFNSTPTKVTEGKMVKVFAWYDNEWGFNCQMLNAMRRMFGLEVRPL